MFQVSMRYGFAIMEPKAMLPLPTVIQEPIYSYTIKTSIPKYKYWDWDMKLQSFIFGEMSLISSEVTNKKIVSYK